jgi:aspartate carbamoyltransferase catalytic subunit
VSFELAAKRLGADVVNLDLHSSSRVKGETVLDTIYTLQAMHVDVFVMRDSEPGIPAFVAAHVQPHVSVLNAGEAHVSHPTQGLLDVLTIRQRKGKDLGSLSVAIVGDIKHSRVARSTGTALQTLGVGELRLVSPASLMPEADEFPGAKRIVTLDDGLRGADVVMALRIQKERMDTSQIPDVDAFCREWGITERSIQLAHKDAIVLHPGPMNRGVEITNAVADGRQSAVQQQVRNGVAVRMAVLATIVRNVQIRNVEAGQREA